MPDEKPSSGNGHRGKKGATGGGFCGGVYGTAFIGAAIYFIQHAQTFWEGVFGIVKALFWPAVLMYKVLELLKL